jgi:hypothetical protein
MFYICSRCGSKEEYKNYEHCERGMCLECYTNYYGLEGEGER